ncbi:MAG: SDR family NAD(P)-dependent oxidoreductase [Rhodobacteraceae bacterium]|nr:SDR family NAD(P)-dependent oxidoreductase [Paracoccaceae bacterium]
MTEKPVALITGASRGLGAALAEELAATHHVVAVARTIGGLEELDDRIKAKGGEATLAPMDVREDKAMQVLCRSIHDRWGNVDVWAHTAIHAAPLAPAPMINTKDWSLSVEINQNATQRLISYVAPLLGASGTAIFFDDTLPGDKFSAAYGATKAAQMALVRAWAKETERTGPRVVIESPAPMPTALRARFYPGENRDGLADTAQVARTAVATLRGH